MSEPQVIIVICMPVKDAHLENVIAGSAKQVCVQCQESVYLSGATQARMDQEREAGINHALLCTSCGRELVKDNPPSKIAPMSSGQMEEMRDHLQRKGP